MLLSVENCYELVITKYTWAHAHSTTKNLLFWERLRLSYSPRYTREGKKERSISHTKKLPAPQRSELERMAGFIVPRHRGVRG